MPAYRELTQSDLAIIASLRASGASWDALAARFNLSRWSVRDKARAAGLHVGKPLAAPVEDEAPRVDRNRPPYPAGHPETWGVIVAGTCLEGEGYAG